MNIKIPNPLKHRSLQIHNLKTAIAATTCCLNSTAFTAWRNSCTLTARPQMFALLSHATWATGLFIIWLGVNMIMLISIYENMTTILEQHFTINYQEVKSICHMDFFALLNHLSFWHVDMMSSGIFFCNFFHFYGHKATTHLWTHG